MPPQELLHAVGQFCGQYFHDQLAPWGTWIEIPGMGWVWRPADVVIQASSGWRPYYDNGQWIQTDNGLFWQSDYRWGDIPFHYCRWVLNPVYGWVWMPDYVWGPAWVFWRHAEVDGAIGWAPLPYGAVFVDGGFLWHGARMGLDFEFGLGEDCFVFVEGGHFHERFWRLRGREWRWHVVHERLHAFYGRSVVFFFSGIIKNRKAEFSSQDITVYRSARALSRCRHGETR